MPNADFPSVSDKSNPRIKLYYPVEGYDEEFILVSPKQSNEYDPIGEVLNSIGLMIDRTCPLRYTCHRKAN